MLQDAGILHDAVETGVDDGVLEPGATSPAAWVTALAYLKARAALEHAGPHDMILGADTVCVMDGRIIGQPRDDAHAASMILGFLGRSHEALTGVCVLSHLGTVRVLTHDAARVTLGHLSMREVSAYIASGEWRGKAGGYNFTQRRAAGWPLEVQGDPDTVVGLPMAIVTRVLDAQGGPAWRQSAAAPLTNQSTQRPELRSAP